MTAETRAQIMGVLQDYQIMAVVCVKTGVAGFTEIATAADILANIQFESGGKRIDAVPTANIAPGAQAIPGWLKPLVSGRPGRRGL